MIGHLPSNHSCLLKVSMFQRPQNVDAKNLPRFATVPTAPAKMDSPKVSGTVPKMEVLNLIRPF